MAIARYQQSPSEIRAYKIDYTAWLDNTTVPPETLTGIVTEVNPATIPALVVATAVILPDLLTAAISVADGELGIDYTITVTVSTSGGQTKQDCLQIDVRNPCE